MKSARSFFTGFSSAVDVHCYVITAEEKIRFLQRSCIACSSLACQEYSIIQVPTRKTSNFCLRVSYKTSGHLVTEMKCLISLDVYTLLH